jgi:hypothetical protein
MDRRLFLSALLTAPAAVVRASAVKDGQVNIETVATIAHSVSCSMKAREVRTRQGWTEASLGRADAILVVCRSALYNPLQTVYRTYCELDEDAENQFNISGTNYHIYLYQLDEDLAAHQIEHVSFEAVN